ncbi:hypothetical protein JOQ06_017666 [Pogonophryne albipinna]|uniref:Uncharacterized protein n=1 Tax=Pogonophryne albipinna TaxID=1090488 RepID=A0AAD6B3Q9_9TELE|nr:hypothetical protein JOQ06_017666 [Pogonophryne albipinna]
MSTNNSWDVIIQVSTGVNLEHPSVPPDRHQLSISYAGQAQSLRFEWPRQPEVHRYDLHPPHFIISLDG